ncbi:GNAT family N-acetyltransferase [Streptomyces sp. TRM70350]|nr:GNAT family N-acetyltransferase [Streptomyces sp. TRM70350]
MDTITDTGLAARLLDDLAPLYEEVFAEPPYGEGPREVGAFIARFQRERQHKGFRLALARDGEHLMGFAYGLPLASDTPWWDALTDVELSDDFTREDGRRTFAVMEVAIRAPHRRRGLARALHAALICGNPAERVTLAVRPEAEPAVALYAALGYRLVGRSCLWDGAPTYLYMLRWLSED